MCKNAKRARKVKTCRFLCSIIWYVFHFGLRSTKRTAGKKFRLLRLAQSSQFVKSKLNTVNIYCNPPPFFRRVQIIIRLFYLPPVHSALQDYLCWPKGSNDAFGRIASTARGVFQPKYLWQLQFLKAAKYVN